MTTPTSAALIAAANDQDLYARMRALAATLGWNSQDIASIRDQLVAAPVNDQGDTVAGVYEYARQNYDPGPTPGEDPAAVTDGYILYAIEYVLGVSS